MSARVWRLLVTGGAARQADEIAEWWQVNRAGSPDLFADELARTLDRLTVQPRANFTIPHPDLPGLRRVLLVATRYHLYYTWNEPTGTLTVHGFWHCARGSPPELG